MSIVVGLGWWYVWSDYGGATMHVMNNARIL